MAAVHIQTSLTTIATVLRLQHPGNFTYVEILGLSLSAMKALFQAPQALALTRKCLILAPNNKDREEGRTPYLFQAAFTDFERPLIIKSMWETRA